jgi:hypothetical protein
LISIFFFTLHYNFGLQNYKFLQANQVFTPEPLHRIPRILTPKSKIFGLFSAAPVSSVRQAACSCFIASQKAVHKELHCHPSRGS